MDRRQSNLELLRIVSILMIVSFHGILHAGFTYGAELSVNKAIVTSIWMFGSLGDNLFVLLSGYFIETSTFKWKKLILLVLEVQFYYWLSYFIGWIVGITEFPTGKDLFLAFFPVLTNNKWWFITAYILLYIVSPYLKLLVQNLDNLEYKKLIITILTIFSFIPTIFGIFIGSTDFLWWNGFVWLICLYLTGGYLRRIQETVKDVSVLLTVASIATIAAFVVIIDFLGDIPAFHAVVTVDRLYIRSMNSIPILALSIGVFGIFLRIHIPYSPDINKSASTALGVYLLSESPQLRDWIWTSVLPIASSQDSPFLILRIIIATAITFLVCSCVDLLRQQGEHTLLRMIQRLRLNLRCRE